MGTEEQFGDIVIAPRVLEKIIAIATAKLRVSTHLKIKCFRYLIKTFTWSWRLPSYLKKMVKFSRHLSLS